MLEPIQIVQLFGALLGCLAFAWRVWDSFVSYLHIDLAVECDKGAVSAKTVVENKSGKDKKIDNALLLVGPESECPIETFNNLCSVAGIGIRARFTNEIATVQMRGPIYADDGRAVIPLPFYYSENVAMGDERLSYRATIDSRGMRPGTPYPVRFFLWAKGRLHRSTHDSFVLEQHAG